MNADQGSLVLEHLVVELGHDEPSPRPQGERRGENGTKHPNPEDADA